MQDQIIDIRVDGYRCRRCSRWPYYYWIGSKLWCSEEFHPFTLTQTLQVYLCSRPIHHHCIVWPIWFILLCSMNHKEVHLTRQHHVLDCAHNSKVLSLMSLREDLY